MDLGLKGKVALISGGSKGIGRRTAEMLALEGCAVAVVGLEDQGAIDEAVGTILSAGGKAIGIAADMTVKANIQRAVGECIQKLGSPDILVANVNGPPPGFFDEVTDEQFEDAVRDMTLSLVYLLRQTLPHMKEQGWGRIVNINSIGAKEPTRFPGHVLVNTGRAAAVALSKSLSDEFAQFGITVNSIGTGFIGTDRMYSYWDRASAQSGRPRDELLKVVTDTIPAGRVGRVDEMAATLTYLCSDLAGYVNGEFINIDGGWHRSAW
ncbi:SDR family oxidoreductase [Streptomyces sp. NPDC001978]|uniref:SDR family oxidoreductase n=1 Tax=Streptomyces sp. NPDC001978 TaxID=3364627 RepID=UPI0036C37883